MYNFELVKKKKRNKRIAIATGIGAIGVTAFAITAFLGRSVGTFTVNLKNEGVALAMDTKSDFVNPTSYLSVSGFNSFTGAHTMKWFHTSAAYPFSKIHNEDFDYKIGAETNGNGIRFFKFTFFLKNVGEYNASYDMAIEIRDNLQPDNGAAPVDEYLRLMIFEGEGNYDGDVYAHASRTREANEKGEYPEYISGAPGTPNDYGEAKLFKDETTLAEISNNLGKGDTIMYTLLFWLEGCDPECEKIPDKASLRIGATINAYPQDKESTN